MVFGAIEIIVLVFAILIIVKLLVIAVSPKSWMKVVKKLYNNPVVLVIVELVLAVIIFYYLLQIMTIVQLMAAITLGALLTGMSFAVYGKDMIAWARKLLRDRSIWKKAWLPILIWLALVVWVLYALFA